MAIQAKAIVVVKIALLATITVILAAMLMPVTEVTVVTVFFFP